MSIKDGNTTACPLLPPHPLGLIPSLVGTEFFLAASSANRTKVHSLKSSLGSPDVEAREAYPWQGRDTQLK